MVPPLSATSCWSGIRSMTGLVGEDVELARVCVVGPEHLPRELDDRALQPQAEAQERDTVACAPSEWRGSCPPRRDSRSRPARGRRPRPSARRRPRSGSSRSRCSLRIQRTLTSTRWWSAACSSASHDADVRVGQLGVLADDRDLERRAGRPDALHQLLPLVEVRLARPGISSSRVMQLAESGPLELERHLVDAPRGLERDDGVDVDVGEERDLVEDLVVDRLVAAQDDDVGLDADAAQGADRVLRRLGLQLAGGADLRQPGDDARRGRFGARRPCASGGSPRGTGATRCRRPSRPPRR